MPESVGFPKSFRDEKGRGGKEGQAELRAHQRTFLPLEPELDVDSALHHVDVSPDPRVAHEVCAPFQLNPSAHQPLNVVVLPDPIEDVLDDGRREPLLVGGMQRERRPCSQGQEEREDNGGPIEGAYDGKRRPCPREWARWWRGGWGPHSRCRGRC